MFSTKKVVKSKKVTPGFGIDQKLCFVAVSTVFRVDQKSGNVVPAIDFARTLAFADFAHQCGVIPTSRSEHPKLEAIISVL